MKNLSIALLVIFICLGCTEISPIVNFGNTSSTDTTYILNTVPTPEPHNVLIEEFTGQSCPNCPAAHETVKGFVGSNPGRVNVIALYKYNFPQTKPPKGAVYDLRDSAASIIADKIYTSVGFMPSAGIDRIPAAGSLLLPTTLWAASFNTALSGATAINLKVTGIWDSTLNQATVVAITTYTKSTTFKQNLTIVVVEDSIIDKQEYPSSDPNFPLGVNDKYIFTSVLRDIVTASPLGDPILPNIPVKEPGRVCQMVYTYKPKTKVPAVVPKRCRIIAFVSNSEVNDGQVVQSAQVKLVP